MKKSKKSKNEENEYWLDDLLEQPENHKNEPDGSILYGYDEEPKLFSQGWWLDKKNALAHVWAAKNPFNDKYDRELNLSALRIFHPDAYRIFFPFTYVWRLIADIIHPEYGTRGDAWYRFFSICSRRNSATLHLWANRMRSSYHLLQTNRNRLGIIPF